MNRFVKTALAFAVAGSAAYAGTGDNEWKALDSEISGLASSLKPSQDGTGWSALIRGVYTHSSDSIGTGGGTNPDVSGFNFNDVDMAFWGNQGPYRWRISADIDNNEGGSGAFFVLEDAYVAWNCGEYFDVKMGNFKPNGSRSAWVLPENLLFIDRTAIGSAMDFWDNGVEASGAWEQLMWSVAVSNGSGASGGGHTRDHLYVARAMWNIGNGAGEMDGARGSSDTLNGTIGASFINDDTQTTVGGNSDHNMWLVDAHGSVSNVGFGGEIAGINNDLDLQTDEDFSNTFNPLNIYGDSQPFNVYVSYLVTPEWEVGVRYEDLDNGHTYAGVAAENDKLLSVVANWYRSGNAGKWQAQWTNVNADTGFDDGNIFEVGFSIGASK
jgi:hypothetical protein